MRLECKLGYGLWNSVSFSLFSLMPTFMMKMLFPVPPNQRKSSIPLTTHITLVLPEVRLNIN